MQGENAAGPSEAGLWHSSSVGAVGLTCHNSDSAQARFDGGACYFGDTGLAVPMEEESAAMAPNLSPRGIDIYVVDKPSSNDEKDLSSSSDAGE